MKQLLMLALLVGTTAARADLRVFACEPEWAALATAIGGDRVQAVTATTARQDPHILQARPSLISQVRRADLVVCTGSQLEVGWLPLLLAKANNPHVRPGSPGYLETSSLVQRLERPATLDRAQGDLHPDGNPHVQLNPHNLAEIARGLATRMAALDPAGNYPEGLAAFLTRWEAATSDWEQRAAPLRGKRLVVHHRSWVYLADWLGLEIVAELEPLPGVPPTTGHLAALLAELGSDGSGADYIVHAPFQDPKAANWLAGRTGIPVVMLPLSVGGSPRATDLYRWFDDIVDRLLQATAGAGT